MSNVLKLAVIAMAILFLYGFGVVFLNERLLTDPWQQIACALFVGFILGLQCASVTGGKTKVV